MDYTFRDKDVHEPRDFLQGWEMEAPGLRNEFRAPKDYGGKRVIVKREVIESSHAVGDLLPTPMLMR